MLKLLTIYMLLSFLIIPSVEDKVALVDEEGSKIYLDEQLGCYVFVTFWSKTCGPCIRSFRNNRDLRDSLIDDGVIIINASIDTKEDWIRACRKYNPNGINAMVEDFEHAQDVYEILNLPVYVTLDPSGNEVSYDRLQYGNINDFADWYKKQ